MCACVVYRAVELSLPTCLVWISTSLSLSPLSTAFFHVLDIRCRTVGQFSNHVGLYNSTSALRLLLFESSEILLAEKNGEFLFDWNSRSSDSYEYRLICSVWILERGGLPFLKFWMRQWKIDGVAREPSNRFTVAIESWFVFRIISPWLPAISLSSLCVSAAVTYTQLFDGGLWYTITCGNHHSRTTSVLFQLLYLGQFVNYICCRFFGAFVALLWISGFRVNSADDRSMLM